MKPALMNLKILLPYQVFAEKQSVTRMVVETRSGSFGLLPHRLDCAAALSPGILVYQTTEEGEAYVAVDEGVLVKTGTNVVISVRSAIGGRDLGKLRVAVENEFLNIDERERSVRSALAKLEIGFLRQFFEFHHG
jgi:F-type H+-transporting ATPase subunit epsilon